MALENAYQLYVATLECAAILVAGWAALKFASLWLRS
jgi:hypothetical protein